MKYRNGVITTNQSSFNPMTRSTDAHEFEKKKKSMITCVSPKTTLSEV